MVQLTLKPHYLLPHLNPDWFYLSGVLAYQTVLEKRLLNGGVCVCVCYAAFNASCFGHKDDEPQAQTVIYRV